MYELLTLLYNDMKTHNYSPDFLENNYSHIFNTVIKVSHSNPELNKKVGELLSLKDFDNTLKIYLCIHEYY